MIESAKQHDTAHEKAYTHLKDPQGALPYANDSFHAIVSLWVWCYITSGGESSCSYLARIRMSYECLVQ